MFSLGSINTTNNFPPQTVVSADNGLSVDPVTGKIVLGNTNDFVSGGTAQLLDARKIFLNSKSIHLLDDVVGEQIDVSISAGMVGIASITGVGTANLTAGAGAAGALFLSSNGAPGLLPRIQFDEPVYGYYFENNAGNLNINDASGGGFSFLGVNASAAFYYLGDFAGKDQGTYFSADASTGDLLLQATSAGFGGLFARLQGPIGTFDVSNAAFNAVYSCNGSPGFTGTVTPVTSITVVGGIVTNVT